MIITSAGSLCLASTPWDNTTMPKLNGLPGFKKFQGRNVLFRPTGANIAYIQENWPDADWQNEAAKHLNEWLHAQANLEHLVELKQTYLEDDGAYQYKTKPWEHQRQAFLLSRDQPSFALLMEQRTGKTKVTLDTAAYLKLHGKIDCLVVVAKNGVHINWQLNEIPVHLPDWCEHITYVHSTDFSKRKQYEYANWLDSCNDGKLRILTMNVEGFTSEKNKKILINALAKYRCLFIIDESHRIRNISALRTKFLLKLGREAIYRRILTGTPIGTGVENLYSQYYFLDPEILGFDSYYTFKARYCISMTLGEGRRSYEKIIGYKNIDELYQKLDPFSYRKRRDEVFDMPPKIYKRWPFEMTTEQSKIYQQLATEYTVEHKGETLDAPLAVTRLIRLQQIACGWWPSDSPGSGTGGTMISKINPRLIALLDILEEVEGKVIIWAQFQADLDLIAKELGSRAVEVHGRIPQRVRPEHINRFQNDAEILYMVANPATLGEGENLNAARTEIYYSNSYKLLERLQSEDRPVAEGKDLTIFDLEAVKTVDRKVIKALKERKNIADLILRDPGGFFLEEDE
jgi:hypothetical protein